MTADQPALMYRGVTTAIIFGSSPNPHRAWTYRGGSARKMREVTGRRLTWYNIYGTEPEHWDREQARDRAENWMLKNARLYPLGTPLLLLGGKVCAAFGISKPEWLEWYASPMWRPLIAFPHPSGLNRWWNDPANTAAATKLGHDVAFARVPPRKMPKWKESE